MNLRGKALDGVAVGATEMKMIVGQFPVVLTGYTKRKILFAIVGHDLMHQAVVAEPVQDPVNGYLVDGNA